MGKKPSKEELKKIVRESFERNRQEDNWDWEQAKKRIEDALKDGDDKK